MVWVGGILVPAARPGPGAVLKCNSRCTTTLAGFRTARNFGICGNALCAGGKAIGLATGVVVTFTVKSSVPPPNVTGKVPEAGACTSMSTRLPGARLPNQGGAVIGVVSVALVQVPGVCCA